MSLRYVVALLVLFWIGPVWAVETPTATLAAIQRAVDGNDYLLL